MSRLMIADDDEFIRKGLQELVAWDELGIEIVGEAGSGNEAFELFERLRPDIVITDIRMPNGSGLDLIRKIREIDPHAKIVVLSGYDDFEYVREAMRYQVEDYLLKPVDAEELTEIMKTCRAEIENNLVRERLARESFQLLRNNVLSRWVEGRIDDEMLREKMHFLKLDLLEKSYYQSALIAWEDVFEDPLPEKERRFRAFSILNVLSECMENDRKGAAFLFDDRHIAAVFAGSGDSPGHFARTNRKWLCSVAERAASLLKTSWFSALGRAVSSPQDVHQSFADARRLLRHVDMTGRVVCVDEESLPAASGLMPAVPEKDRTAWVLSGLSGERGAMKQAWREECQRAAAQPNGLETVKSLAAEWVVLVRQMAKQVHPPFRSRLMESMTIRDIFRQTSVEEVHRLLSGWLAALEEEAAAHAKARKQSIVHRVEQYLREHFHEDINLQLVADRFKVNNVYLGRLFKQETGQYFSDYLNRLRMEKAKELLAQTDRKASDIGLEAGFADPNYFFRKFKKMVGMSPTEYRRLFGKPREDQ